MLSLSYTLDYVDQIDSKMKFFTFDDIKIFVDPKSSLFLIGTEVDYVEGELESFRLLTPMKKVGVVVENLSTSSFCNGIFKKFAIGNAKIK